MPFCKRCKKRLIKPESIVIGYGAVCFKKELSKTPYIRKSGVVKMKGEKIPEQPLNSFNLSEWFKNVQTK